MPFRPRLLLPSLFIGSLATAANTGCNVLNFQPRESTSSLDLKSLQNAGYAVDESGALLAAPHASSSSGLPTVVLDIRNGEQHMERIPLSPDKPMFVSDVIKDAKLVERIGKIKVSVVRETTPSTPPVRMDVDFDSKGKEVMQEQNYALQPNDRVIVRKNDRTWFDDAMESLPLRRGRN